MNYTEIKNCYEESVEKWKGNNLVKDLISGRTIKILLYTHFDLDGLGPIPVLNQFQNVELEYVIFPKDANACQKDIDTRWQNFNYILFTDISVNEEVAELIDSCKYFEGYPEIILLDHHTSATHLNSHDWAYVIPQDLKNEFITSGTLLFCIYIYDALITLYNEKVISEFAKLVSYYDTFYFKSESAMERYPNKEPYRLNLMLQFMSKEEFIQAMTVNFVNNKIFDEKDEYGIAIMQKIIDKECWKCYYNTQIMKISGYTVAFVYCDSYISQVAEFIYDKFPEIDYTCTVNMNTHSVSLRTKKDIDLSKNIAVPNGGGGHPQACGFEIDSLDMVFRNEILKYLELGPQIFGTIRTLKKANDEYIKDDGEFNLGLYLENVNGSNYKIY